MTPDAAQSVIVDARVDASGVIIGAPGTGKTHTLVDRVARLIRDVIVQPDELLVLTPSRQVATQLRDRIGVRIGQATPGPLARSLGSFAFQLVRGAMVHEGLAAPKLLTGADQDRIIADLLDGDAEDEVAGMSRWPETLGPAIRSSRDFRSELRAFIAECSELGVGTEELRRSTRESWRAAGEFTDEYRRVLDGLRAAHRDAADLLNEAAGILSSNDAAKLGQLASLRVVFLDDAQELTHGGIAVVQALRAKGIAVMAFGDPDISSGAFRGASPELFARLASALGHVYVLDTPHRQNPALTALTRTITQAIGAAGLVDHRRAPAPIASIGVGALPAIRTFHAPSPYEEVDRIAAVLRDWHLLQEVPWEQMAVLAHDTRQVALLETELTAREVPTRAAGVQRPLGSESVVRDIVRVVRLAMTPVLERDSADLAELLLSPFGGLDIVGLRRLRGGLRYQELKRDGATPARELLRAELAEPNDLLLLDTAEARAAIRFSAVLRDVAMAATAGETIHDLLWRVWDASRSHSGRRLADAWQEAASIPGNAETSRALDALVSLFDAAKRSVERAPENGPHVFIHDILESEVPEDSLSAPDRAGTVTLLTPATALGTEFEAVVIAGVQDGVWPNVRLRGSLLDTWQLAGSIAAARAGEPEELPEVRDRRRTALHDELRLFVRAVSRAKSRLFVTAVNDDDNNPSALFGFLPPPPDIDDDRMAYPLTLRGLVARHRRTLTTSHDAAEREAAAGQLVLLAEAEVPGADPSEWYGIATPSSAAGLRDLESRGVRVSPSRLEAFEECGLGWAISALGGDTVTAPSAGIGTILHAAMEQVPDGNLAALREVVETRWPELDFATAWIGRKERRRADVYVDRMHSYLREVDRDGGRVIAAEAPFRFAVELANPDQSGAPKVIAAETEEPWHALVSGVIDRVEIYPAGAGEHAGARGRTWTPMDANDLERVVIVDLKSGKYELEKDADVVAHAQLAAYQIAVEQGLVDGAAAEQLGGARLVVVSKTIGKSDYRVAHQPTLDDEARGAFLQRVVDAGNGMAASSFTAQVHTHCADTQAYVRSCRIHTVEAVSS